MDGDFTDYKPGYYTVEFSQADDFRNKDKTPEDLAKWGTSYAVKFKGDAGTFYWSSRTQPEEDQRVYGHVEPSKSGKSMNFRRDEDPNKGVSPANSIGSPAAISSSPVKDKPYLRDVTAIPLDVWRALLNVQGVPENPEQFGRFFETVRSHAEELLMMIDNIRSPLGKVPSSPAIKEHSPAATESLSLGDTYRERKVSGEHDYGDESG